ncbi:hypothetical protein QTO34_009262 [Cnephaeus nilssonii]|uniref:LRRC37A/B like protein 1 C-terminal domain-containing protein n=1 Tax=Cnephaeus nilssonii TaxID=3371016 RepID=A0AA40HIF0_CNENI|nr:hypothetical protein QTO34_009262 [Eptesicus nilssonii]
MQASGAQEEKESNELTKEVPGYENYNKVIIASPVIAVVAFFFFFFFVFFCLIAICHSKEATKESSRGSLASVQQNKSAEYQLEKGGFWRRLFLWLKNKKNELKLQDTAENEAFLKMEQGEEATGNKMDASESPGEDAAEESVHLHPLPGGDATTGTGEPESIWDPESPCFLWLRQELGEKNGSLAGHSETTKKLDRK